MISASLCPVRIRTSSPPAYPVEPIIPAFIILKAPFSLYSYFFHLVCIFFVFYSYFCINKNHVCISIHPFCILCKHGFLFFYFRICPFPKIIYFVVVSASSPIGPLACNFCVLIPISAPNPNSNPSVNLVDALTYTAAASISS